MELESSVQFPDFRELLSLLNSHGIEYLLVGGYTVGAHGFPRYTGDIDIFYRLADLEELPEQ